MQSYHQAKTALHHRCHQTPDPTQGSHSEAILPLKQRLWKSRLQESCLERDILSLSKWSHHHPKFHLEPWGWLVLHPIISTLLPHFSVCMTQSFCTQTPPTCYLSAVISFSFTFLFYQSPADPFPGNDVTPSLWSVDFFMFAVSVHLPLQFTCPFSSCPFWLMLNTTWGLYDLFMFIPHFSTCQNAPLPSRLDTWHQLWVPLWFSLIRNMTDIKEHF